MSQTSSVQELHEKIERSLLKIFITVFGFNLLLGRGGHFSFTEFQAWQVRRVLAEANTLLGGFSETDCASANCCLLRTDSGWQGDFPRAAKFLDLGAKANLLPEERKLVEKAQLTIARR